MAQSDAQLHELNKYRVEEADLGNNPDTRDNVIVYSDRGLSRSKKHLKMMVVGVDVKNIKNEWWS
jgi:hypothetical protein